MKKNFIICSMMAFACHLSHAQQTDKLSEFKKDEYGNIYYAKVDEKYSIPITETTEFLKSLLIESSHSEFKKVKSEKDQLGYLHEKFEQYYGGVKIDGGGGIVHSKNNRIEFTIANLHNVVKGLAVSPLIAESTAFKKATAVLGARKFAWDDPLMEKDLKLQKKDNNATYLPKGRLVIVKIPDQPSYRLAYQFAILATDPYSDNMVTVDAVNGKIISKTDMNSHFNTPGPAQTRYNGTQTIITDSYSGGYRLRETTRGQGIETYNLNKTDFIFIPTTFSDFSDNDNNWTSLEYNNANWDNAALDAHWSAEMTYDYFLQKHNRSSFDNAGAPIKTYVHYGVNVGNAFWIPRTQIIACGDGDATRGPLTDVEVMGHEFGHGLYMFTVNNGNEYPTPDQNERALSEALADIWGVCVENFVGTTVAGRDPWLIGEKLTTNGTPIVSIRNPSSTLTYAGTPYPDTYKGTGYTHDGDDPHINATVVDYWFYLLSEGGSGTNDVNKPYCVVGIGIDKAAKIVYRAENDLLPVRSRFSHFGIAVKQAAIDLYGVNSIEYRQVRNALVATNLEEEPWGFNMSITGDALQCSSGNYTLTGSPVGSPITWYPVTPSGIVNMTSGGNGANVSRIGSASGQITLSAEVFDGGCSYGVTTKSITVGVPLTVTGFTTFVNYCLGGSDWELAIQANQNPIYPIPQQWIWSYNGSDLPPSTSDIFSTYEFPPSCLNIGVKTVNGCGVSSPLVWTFCPPCSGFRIVASPNPSKDVLNISLVNSEITTKQSPQSLRFIKEIKIFDKMGLLRKQQKFSSNTTTVQVNVANLSPDTYTLSIFDGKNWISEKIMKE